LAFVRLLLLIPLKKKIGEYQKNSGMSDLYIEIYCKAFLEQ
jgi:hypothetical protein